MKKTIKLNFKHSIFIEKSPDEVWDFTQDYELRPNWDRSVSKAEVIESEPPRLVMVTAPGGMESMFEYKQEDRPRQTSLKISDTNSPIILGGGGSWRYEAKEGGTLWTQSVSLIIRGDWYGKLLKPVINYTLKTGTRNSMKKAKQMLEAN